MSLEERIKIIKNEFGVTQEDLLNILRDNGIDASIGTIKGWWQGKTRNILPKYAIVLAKHFRLNREWIETGIGSMKHNDDSELTTLQELANIAKTFNNENMVTVQYFENINASAGSGCINDTECIPTYIQLQRNILPIKSDTLEAIRVSGDSMQGTIEDGDIIFIDRNYTTLINGKIYVVYMAGEVYVKRIFKNPNSDHLILKSDNPIFPQFEALSEDFKIIGKVVANMNIREL